MSINTIAVDNTLEQLAIKNTTRFNAYYVSSLSHQVDVHSVNDYLLFKAKFGVLRVKIETICPNNHPDLQIDFEKPFPTKLVECRICDAEYFPDILNTNVVFYFELPFIEEVKKKQKM